MMLKFGLAAVVLVALLGTATSAHGNHLNDGFTVRTEHDRTCDVRLEGHSNPSEKSFFLYRVIRWSASVSCTNSPVTGAPMVQTQASSHIHVTSSSPYHVLFGEDLATGSRCDSAGNTCASSGVFDRAAPSGRFYGHPYLFMWAPSGENWTSYPPDSFPGRHCNTYGSTQPHILECYWHTPSVAF